MAKTAGGTALVPKRNVPYQTDNVMQKKKKKGTLNTMCRITLKP
jgi:hypothetical protein